MLDLVIIGKTLVWVTAVITIFHICRIDEFLITWMEQHRLIIQIPIKVCAHVTFLNNFRSKPLFGCLRDWSTVNHILKLYNLIELFWTFIKKPYFVWHLGHFAFYKSLLFTSSCTILKLKTSVLILFFFFVGTQTFMIFSRMNYVCRHVCI